MNVLSSIGDDPCRKVLNRSGRFLPPAKAAQRVQPDKFARFHGLPTTPRIDPSIQANPKLLVVFGLRSQAGKPKTTGRLYAMTLLPDDLFERLCINGAIRRSPSKSNADFCLIAKLCTPDGPCSWLLTHIHAGEHHIAFGLSMTATANRASVMSIFISSHSL
jgi:hypothetical protein